MALFDNIIRIGLSDREYRRDLKKLGADTDKELARTAVAFDRHQNMLDRRTRERTRALNKMYRSTAVVAAASAATITGAIGKAAERNKDLEAQVGRVRAAYDGLITSVGQDLGQGGIVAYLERGIRTADRLRTRIVDALAAGISDLNSRALGEAPGGADLVEASAEDRRVQAAFRAQNAAAEIQRQIAAMGGGPDAREAEELAIRRAYQQQIGQSGADPATQQQLREQLDAALTQQRADRERVRSAQRAADSASHAARIARARSGSSPYDTEAAQNAARAERQAEAARAASRINSDTSLTSSERAQRLREDAEARQAELAAEQDQARRQGGRDLLGMRAERLALGGNTRAAEAARIALDYEERRAQVLTNTLISEQQRTMLLEEQEKLLTAQINQIVRGNQPDVIGPGFLGGATGLRQITGSPGGAQRDLDRIRTMVEQSVRHLAQIAQNTGNGAGAVLAP